MTHGIRVVNLRSTQGFPSGDAVIPLVLRVRSTRSTPCCAKHRHHRRPGPTSRAGHRGREHPRREGRADRSRAAGRRRDRGPSLPPCAATTPSRPPPRPRLSRPPRKPAETVTAAAAVKGRALTLSRVRGIPLKNATAAILSSYAMTGRRPAYERPTATASRARIRSTAGTSTPTPPPPPVPLPTWWRSR